MIAKKASILVLAVTLARDLRADWEVDDL